MSFLSTLGLLVVRASLGRAELFAVLLGDDLTGSVKCVGRQRGAIGTHVGNKALFVQGLGGAHGHGRRQVQLAAGFLLQGRGDERCSRAAAKWLGLDRLDLGRLIGQLGDQ